MAHNRTEIRNALVALLTPALVSATLYVERRYRIDSNMRPLVILSLSDDAIDDDAMTMAQPGGAYTVEHTQQVLVEIHAEGASGDLVADAIDQIELEIEGALASDLSLGGLVENIRPVGSELTMDTSQDRVIGLRAVTYTAQWRSEFGKPDTPET